MQIHAPAYFCDSEILLKPRKQRGFALVATISVMVLLVLVALAMLSLSTIELRASGISKAQEDARANARMALMIAIGELQKAAGPDQRITANASIFDDTPETTALTDVEHPHYLAVMDSWDTFLNEDKYVRDEAGEPTSASLKIADTYKRGRHESLFRRYLVSHADQSLLQRFEAATDSSVLGLDDDNSIHLVGSGPAGSGSPESIVRAGLVELSGPDGNLSGRHAWWVGGLNSRAAMDIKHERVRDNSLAGLRDASQEGERYDITAMNGLNNFPTDKEHRPKLVTPAQAQLIAPNKNALKDRVFDLGTGGQWSLLTDVRSSGMKKDLNSFFELDWRSVPNTYRQTVMNRTLIEAPLRSVNGLDKLGVIEKNVPPTSWRQLKDYYSLYLQNAAHPNHLGAPQAHLTWDSNGLPMSDSFMCGQPRRLAAHHHDYDNADTLSYTRMPVIARWLYVLSLSSVDRGGGFYDLYMHTNPVIVLWNPYNTHIRMQNRGTTFISGHETHDSDFMIQPRFLRSLRLEYKAYRNDSSVLRNWSELQADYGAGSWQDVFFKEKDGRTDVILKPGEVKMFSFDSSVAGWRGHRFMTPGFNPDVKNDPRQRFRVGTVAASDTPSIALRFSSHNGRGSAFAPKTSTEYGGGASAFGMDSLGQVFRNQSGQVAKTTRGHRGGCIVEWFSRYGVQIIPDRIGERAAWRLGVNKPVPEAAVGMFLKSAVEMPEEDGTLASSKDVRSRNWLHSNPAHWWRHIFRPQIDGDLKRSNFPYELHYNGNLSGNSVSSLVQSDDEDRAYIGPSIDAGDGVSAFTYQELPIAPVTNLAALSGMRLTNGKTVNMPFPLNHNGGWGRNYHYPGAWGAAFGLGIGNAYAHPMINPTEIYTGYSNHTNHTNQRVFANYWDTLFMANDALWDSWFCSSMSPQSTPAYSANRSRDQVVDDFLNDRELLPNQRLRLTPHNLSDYELSSAFKADDSYEKVAAYLRVRGGFNVNTASVEAWKALLHGLKGSPTPYVDAETLEKGELAYDDELILSRFAVATGKEDGDDPNDPNAWKGIRRLSDSQIDRLAEEIVKQVKLRGPFLNMSDFINRRLSNDRFGVSGALQAAIDWDEFDNNYRGGGSGHSDSINGKFKGGGDSISSPTASFTNVAAARGSRYSGIPGYVMQSDLLRKLGNTLTVRDDSFVIRAYGEATDSTGKVLARAWCEATVQRIPDYLITDNSNNSPEKPAYTLDTGNRPVASTTLAQENLKFGRKFEVTSFRWLSKDEL